MFVYILSTLNLTGNESEFGSVCAGKWSELKGKGLAAVQKDEDIDCLAVIAPWVPQHERDAPQKPILQCHGRKGARTTG